MSRTFGKPLQVRLLTTLEGEITIALSSNFLYDKTAMGRKGRYETAMSEKKCTYIKIMAGAGLLLTTIIWGSAFVVMKNSVDAIPPTYLLALRFTLAAVALILVFFKKVRAITRKDLQYGSILGALLFTSYLFQTYGLKYTTASKNAFITTLYVILVPFLHWMINRIRPKKKNVAAAVIAVVGLALLSLDGQMAVNIGDVLTLICGLCFALHIVYIDRYTVDHDPVILTVVQIAVAALLNWCLAPVLDGGFDFSVIDSGLLMSLLYLGIFSTMIGFLLQNVGQKYLTPNTSSILLSFESVFGLVFSVIFLGDPVTLRLLTGCALMFGAIILSEYKRKEKAGGAADSRKAKVKMAPEAGEA